MKHIMTILVALWWVTAFSQTPTAEEIIKKVDANLVSKTQIVTSEMIIHGRRGSRTVVAKTWQRGTEDAFTEYLAPPREKGTKMLKLGDQLWVYSPATDRTILISGHLLRQSVMGSDLSYEDMMEDPLLEKLYTPEIVGEDTLLGRPVWVLELTARVEDVAYYRRKLWVDKTRYIPLKEALYAKGGKLLKQVEVHEVKRIEGRWVIIRATFKDMLKDGNGTEWIIKSIEFDKKIPDFLFSKAALRR
jgi:outer membrane lipoprotein-sorting protein